MQRKATQAALHKMKCLGKTRSIHPQMADLFQASYPFPKSKWKRTLFQLIFCWECCCSIATPHIQLMKPTGYSGDLGQSFINILFLPVSAVSSLIANWTEETGL